MALIKSTQVSIKTVANETKTTVVVHLEGTDVPVFLSPKQVESATGVKNNYQVLVGSDLVPTYWKKDEVIPAFGNKPATTVTDDNKILKRFDFTLSSNMSKLQMAVAAGFGTFSL